MTDKHGGNARTQANAAAPQTGEPKAANPPLGKPNKTNPDKPSPKTASRQDRLAAALRGNIAKRKAAARAAEAAPDADADMDEK